MLQVCPAPASPAPAWGELSWVRFLQTLGRALGEEVGAFGADGDLGCPGVSGPLGAPALLT